MNASAWRQAVVKAWGSESGQNRCPINDDDELILEWEPLDGSESGATGRLYCPSCGASVEIDVTRPK
jgi:hypothetical protein